MEEDTTISIIAETQPYEEKLDSEITSIKEQIAALSHRSSILSTHLLTSKASQSLLHQSQPSSNGVRPTQHETSPLLSALATRSRAQTLHNQQNLHRLCAGVTTFSVRDPDPRALDSGRILGVRIEALSKGSFLTPYYLFLLRPQPLSPNVIIHRHTVPPCIPLPSLAARYLPPPPPPPPPSSPVPQKGSKPQNLPRLVKELRREIVAYHRRKDAVQKIREDARHGGVKEIESTDAEVREVRIEWQNGGVGRLRLGKDGKIEKVVILGSSGRNKEIERKLIAEDGTVNSLGDRLRQIEDV